MARRYTKNNVQYNIDRDNDVTREVAKTFEDVLNSEKNPNNVVKSLEIKTNAEGEIERITLCKV